MKHLKPINKKAHRIDGMVSLQDADVVALQQGPQAQKKPHVPMGCAIALPSSAARP